MSGALIFAIWRRPPSTLYIVPVARVAVAPIGFGVVVLTQVPTAPEAAGVAVVVAGVGPHRE